MLPSLRVALRNLSRRRAASAVAIASLAAGLGINSAVFSVVDTMFVRPPAVTQPEQLVEIGGQFRDSAGSGSAASGRRVVLDWADFEEIATQVPAFSGVTAYMGRGGLWRNGDEMTLLLVDAVADNYFDLLGVRPYLGHLPAAAAQPEEGGGGDPPIVLTYWLWKERLGGRPEAIGERIQFRDHTWRIAAVLPPQFRGLSATGQRHIWIPISSWNRYFRGDTNRGSGQFFVVGRLKDGVSPEQAQAQLDTLSRRIEASDSRVPKGRRLSSTSVGKELRDNLRPGLLILAAAGLVLLVACANVAAMLLAQTEARRREIGLRLSLGAGTWALTRQFLMESVVLVVPGAILGLLLASWMLTAAPALAPPSPVPLHFDFRMDLRLLAFSSGCVLFTVVVFGLSPLIYALRVSLIETIAGARTAGQSRSTYAYLRPAMVSLQVAMSVVLVAGALVLGRAFSDSRAIDPGYDASRPLALIFANVDSRRGGSATSIPDHQLFEQAANRMAEATGGIEAVTYARHLPLMGSGAGAAISVTPQGAPPEQPPARVYFNLVGPNYFEVVGARLLNGRTFSSADHAEGAARVVIVNAEAARRFWPAAQENPHRAALGRTLRLSPTESYEVIGIANDGRIGSLHEPVAPAVFLPASRMSWGETILIARTRNTVDPALVLKELARAAGQVPALRVYQSTTLRSVMDQALYDDWIPALFGAALALLGLVLAAGGLYGAISYITEQRLGEFGIRMAIGARTAEIASLVLRQAARYCLAGIPLGILGFIAAYRYLGPDLLRNRPLDPMALLAGALLTIAVVQLGAILPALRAARLDPLQVLRGD